MMKLLILFSFFCNKIFNNENVAQEETHAYQAEISRLLDIIINSLYTHQDIFLRELISNASDALDKIRYLSIKKPELMEQEPNLEIKILIDEQNQALTIWDTGIGMNREDLINNLGTIARSGTTQFLEAMRNKDSLNQIGQFGVGFYSVFLVAAHITVVSRKAEEEDQWIWTSDASNGFKLAKDLSENKISRGTKLILKLKDDMKEYLKGDKLKKLIKKYSNYIDFPILLQEEKDVDEEVALNDEELAQQEEDIKKKEEEKERKKLENPEAPEEEEKPIERKTTKKVSVKKMVFTRINSDKALWLKNPQNVEEQEYKEFYKSLSDDFSEPLDKIHFKVEGEIEFTSLLYIPKVSPYANMMRMQEKDKKPKASLKLFVRRVLISDDFKELLPSYFHFIKGVVDSDDLPLNVSRETLQQEKTLKIIKKKLVKKIIEKLTQISKGQVEEENLEDEDKMTDEQLDELDKKMEQKKKELIELYDQFWKQNGQNIKLGMVEDKDNRKLLSKISRWKTTKDKGEKYYGFDEYLERKKTNQTAIFYLGGDDMNAMLENPVLKSLTAKGYEVVLCIEPLDEYILRELDKYEEVQLTNIALSGFQIPQDEKEAQLEKKIATYYEPLSKWIKELLKEEVESVSVKMFNEEDPMIILAGDKGFSANMQNLLKYQSQLTAEEKQMQLQGQKKNIILNPYHPIVKELLERVQQGADKETEEQLKLLFNSSLIRAGFELSDKQAFQKLFQNIMKDQFGIPRNVSKVDLDIKLDEEVAQEEKEPAEEEKTEETTEDVSQEEIKAEEL